MLSLPPLAGIFLRNWHWIAIGTAFALLSAWAWRVDSLRGHYKALAASEKAAHAQTVANYRNAQEAAQALFDAKIQAIQLKNKEANDEADKRVADLRADYAERVRRLPRAAACPAGSAGLSAPDIPEGSDGPGGDAIVLGRADALICAENTARLQSAHQWALGGTE